MAREAVALAGVEWEPCLLEPRRDPEITRLVRQRLGFVPPHVHYYSACPWLVRLIIHFDYSTVPFKHLDQRLVELIALVVAQDNSCRFCYAAPPLPLRLPPHARHAPAAGSAGRRDPPARAGRADFRAASGSPGRGRLRTPPLTGEPAAGSGGSRTATRGGVRRGRDPRDRLHHRTQR